MTTKEKLYAVRQEILELKTKERSLEGELTKEALTFKEKLEAYFEDSNLSHFGWMIDSSEHPITRKYFYASNSLRRGESYDMKDVFEEVFIDLVEDNKSLDYIIERYGSDAYEALQEIMETRLGGFKFD